MANCALAVPIPSELGIALIHVTPRSELKPLRQCEFEKLVAKLGLHHESMRQLASASSYRHIQLRLWCRKNAHRRYVPTELLEAWGIETYEESVAWTLE